MHDFPMSTWRNLLNDAMRKHGETFDEIECSTISNEDMQEEFDAGHGSISGAPFTIWTTNRVYFPVTYDGSEWVGSVSRHPDGKPTEHQGGPGNAYY